MGRVACFAHGVRDDEIDDAVLWLNSDRADEDMCKLSLNSQNLVESFIWRYELNWS
jgi:hypothetical protein